MSGHVPDTFVTDLFFSHMGLWSSDAYQGSEIFGVSGRGGHLLFQPTSRGTPAGSNAGQCGSNVKVSWGVLPGPGCWGPFAVVVCNRRTDEGARVMESAQVCGRYVETRLDNAVLECQSTGERSVCCFSFRFSLPSHRARETNCNETAAHQAE